MTLDALRFFCALIEETSFRGAAERLHRSQPAVSQQIKALERELGHTLVDRKTCKPTPAGGRLYQRARHVLNQADSLAREIEDLDEAHAQELRVGTSDTTALYVLPPVVRAFSHSMPHTRLMLVNRPTDDIAEHVLRGELDLGIVTLPTSRAELAELDLFQERLVLVTPTNHSLAGRRQVRLAALKDEPLLLLSSGTRTGRLLREFFGESGFEPQVVLDSGSFEVIKRYVVQGVGSAFLPEVVVTKQDRGLAKVAVPGLPSVRIGAVWRRGAYQTKAELAFLRLVEEHRPSGRG